MAELPDDLVYAGISLGVMPAQRLAQTRPGAAVRCCSRRARRPPRSPTAGRRPCRCRCTGWSATRSSGSRATSTPRASWWRQADDGELFVYPGDVHLFTDSSLPSYDEAASAEVVTQVLEFLSRV